MKYLTMTVAALGPDAASFLKSIDLNGDGVVDQEEFSKLPTSPPA
jgi:hypothetical protein